MLKSLSLLGFIGLTVGCTLIGNAENTRRFNALDADGDGYLAMRTLADGSLDGDDCDDTNATVHPDATELCDGVDTDCDGLIPEDERPDWLRYIDADGDGFGDASRQAMACTDASLVSDNADDCDDLSAAVHPGADEGCDGLDTNCDDVIPLNEQIGSGRLDRDGDGFGDPNAPAMSCLNEAVPLNAKTDCDDTDATVNPDAAELCDGVDTDCKDGIPAYEVVPYYLDADGDGYGDDAVSLARCLAPSDYVPIGGDCQPDDASINPGAIERPGNAVDEDCDGDAPKAIVYLIEQSLNGRTVVDGTVQTLTIRATNGGWSAESVTSTSPLNVNNGHGDTLYQLQSTPLSNDLWIGSSSGLWRVTNSTPPERLFTPNSAVRGLTFDHSDPANPRFFLVLANQSLLSIPIHPITLTLGDPTPRSTLPSTNPPVDLLYDATDDALWILVKNNRTLYRQTGTDTPQLIRTLPTGATPWKLSRARHGRLRIDMLSSSNYLYDPQRDLLSVLPLRTNLWSSCAHPIDPSLTLGFSSTSSSVFSDADGRLSDLGGPTFTFPYDCELPWVGDADHDGHLSLTRGGDDCDDHDASVHPEAVDFINDTIDQNCDGVGGVDEDLDGFYSLFSGGLDCDDANPLRYPSATEQPNSGVDEDCDGVALIEP